MAALKLNLRCRDLAPSEATLRLRENYVIAPVAGKKIRSRVRSLLIVGHGLRRRFARFKLCAHFLDLRSLLVETRSQLCNCRLEVLR
jgi:hypothetical protein